MNMKNIARLAIVAVAAATTLATYAKSSKKVLAYGDTVLEPEDYITFTLDEFPDEIGGREVLTEYLPNGIDVEWTGKKFKPPKSASPKVKKVDGDWEIVVKEKGEDNPCSLSVSYKAKKGTVSGSFKVYTVTYNSKGKPKLKSYTAKYSGVLGQELSVSIKKAGIYTTATLE